MSIREKDSDGFFILKKVNLIVSIITMARLISIGQELLGAKGY